MLKYSTLNPNLKATEERFLPTKTVDNWLLGMRKKDNIGDYWRINDSLYDFSKFRDSHPGG